MPAGHSTRLLENPRRRSSGRLKRAVGLAFAIAVCALTTLIAAPAEAGPATVPPASLPAIVSALNLQNIPVSYVILVDVSGSMLNGGLYDTVRNALPDLISAMSPHDNVAIDTFGDAPLTVRAMAPVGDGASADAALDGVTVDSQANTDMGGALNLAYSQLAGQDPLGGVGVVLLLTDGKPDVRQDQSIYYLPGVNTDSSSQQDATAIDASPQWQNLRGEFAKLSTGGMTVLGCGLPLRPGIDLQPVLNGVFTNPYIDTDPNMSTLLSFIHAAQAQVQTTEAAQLLQPDSGAGVAVTLSSPGSGGSWSKVNLAAGSVTATMTLASDAKHAPLTVSDPKLVATGDLPLTVTGLPATITVEPGQPVTLPIVLHWNAPAAESLDGSRVARTTTFRFTGAVASPWSTVIASISGKTFAPGTLTAAPTALDATEAGALDIGGWLEICAVALVLLLGLYAGYARLFPSLSGSLEIRVGQESHESIPLRRRNQSLGHITVGGETAKVKVRSARRAKGGSPMLRIVCTTLGTERRRDKGRIETGGVRILSGGWQFHHRTKS